MQFYKETEFKEVELNGRVIEIPEDWEVVRLGDVAEIRKNKSISNVKEVAFISMDLIPDSGIYVNYEMRSLNNVKSSIYCEAGDLLLAKITPCFENGKQGIVPDDIPNGFALATTEVFPIICKKINKLFLFYILKYQRFRKLLEYSMRGTTGRLRLPKEAVERFKIPLPPLEEQKKIAHVLRTIDNAIEIVDKAIEKLERIKKATMEQLLTKGIGHKEFKMVELDGRIIEIPKDWEIVKLKNIAKVKYGRSLPKEEGDIPAVGSSGIFKFVSKALINKPAIIVGRKGTAGSVHLLEQPSWPSDTTFYLDFRSLNSINLRYVYYHMIFLKLSGEHAKTTLPSLKREELENYLIKLPPLEEQKQIAKILKTIDEAIELKKKKKEKLERMKKAVMNKLLTGQIRIK